MERKGETKNMREQVWEGGERKKEERRRREWV